MPNIYTGAFPQSVSSLDRYGYEGLPPELAAEEQAINRRQQMANYLIQQGLQPAQGQMAGRFYVAPSPWQGLAGLAQVGAGIYGGMQADKARQGISGKSNAMLQEALRNYQQASGPKITEGPRPTAMVAPEPVMSGIAPQPQQAPIQTELPGPGAPVSTPVSPDQKQQAIVEQLMLSKHPQAQRTGDILSRLTAAEQERAANRDFLTTEHALNRDLQRDLSGSKIDQMMALGLIKEATGKQMKDELIASQERMNKERIQGTKDVAGIMAQSKVDAAAGKTALKEHDTELGQQTVHGVVASLRDQYNQLNESGGITSTEKGPLENVVAGVSSSAGGQMGGKIFGTKNQSLRNTIAQQRPILMQAIMKATGMTARQMDSNVELKLWLSTATDPTLDYQTNMKALEMLENLYGGKGTTGQAAPQATGMTPTVQAFPDPEKQKRYEEFKKKQPTP
jgi:hypothetical protein